MNPTPTPRTDATRNPGQLSSQLAALWFAVNIPPYELLPISVFFFGQLLFFGDFQPKLLDVTTCPAVSVFVILFYVPHIKNYSFKFHIY